VCLSYVWFGVNSGRGKTTAISTSKIKNRIVIKKNRKEKVERILCCGSNPHSKMAIFSRFLFIFVFNIVEINMTSKIIRIITIKYVISILLFIA